MHGIGPVGSNDEAAKWSAQVARNPADLIARHNLGTELYRLDRYADALAELDRAWREGLRTGETAMMRGHALARLGEFETAEIAYLDAIAIKPALTEPPKALAALRPQLKRGSDPLEGYRRALSGAPDTGILWIEAMGAAKGHKAWGLLLEWVKEAERRFGNDTVLEVFAANALSSQGRDAEALDRLLRAAADEPDFAPAHTTLAHIYLRLGEFRKAEAAASIAARLDPFDQSGWALLGTAWRLLQDPREDWLCRYDAFVLEIAVDLPPGLEDILNDRHQMQAQPADQSLRGGTQTAGNLFETGDMRIVSLANALRRTIGEQIEKLPVEAGHPFLSRNTGEVAFSASWSVRLADEGYHVSHIHPVGWMSSAMYVSLPPEVDGSSSRGALAFGVPDEALGLDLPPRKVVVPAEGKLVLFPSYLWHGTTRFHSVRPRLTVAFDLVPIEMSI